MNFYNSRYAITFGEIAILHVGGMEIGNKMEKGYTVDELKNLENILGNNAEYISLSDKLPENLRKDNLGKEQKEKYAKLEKLIIPLLIKLAKSPEAYIHWPNRAQVIEAQVKKIIEITRGK